MGLRLFLTPNARKVTSLIRDRLDLDLRDARKPGVHKPHLLLRKKTIAVTYYHHTLRILPALWRATMRLRYHQPMLAWELRIVLVIQRKLLWNDLYLWNGNDKAASPLSNVAKLFDDLLTQVPRQDQHIVRLGPTNQFWLENRYVRTW